jgi:hypothetical protein
MYPNVNMARDVMILMWANPLQGPLEGWTLKIKTIYGNEHEASAIRAPESRDFQGPPRPMALVIDLPSSRGGGGSGTKYQRYKSEITAVCKVHKICLRYIKYLKSTLTPATIYPVVLKYYLK